MEFSHILEDTDAHLTIAIGQAHRAIEQLLGRESAKTGLSNTQFHVLAILYYMGPCSVNQIIAALFSSSGNIDVVFNNLLKRCLITKEIDEEDKRKRRITLTSKGRKLAIEAMPPHLEILHQNLHGLSKQEKQQLTALLEKLKQTL